MTIKKATPQLTCFAVSVGSHGGVYTCQMTEPHPIDGRHAWGDDDVVWVGTAPDNTRGLSEVAWIIDKDHLDLGSVLPGVDPDEGTTGPHNAPTGLLQRLANGEGIAFRMLDDDGELYYTGRIIGPDGVETTEDGFRPLWDFGTPNAGAVTIQYRGLGGDNRWESL